MTSSIIDNVRRSEPEKTSRVACFSQNNPVQSAYIELFSKSIPYSIRADTLHDPQKAPDDLLATISYVKRTYPKIYLAYRKSMNLDSDEAFRLHLIEKFKRGTCYGRASSLIKQVQYTSLLSPIDNNDVFYYQLAQTLKNIIDNPDYLTEILVTYPLTSTAYSLQKKAYEAQQTPHFNFSVYQQKKLLKYAHKLKELNALPKIERDEEKRLRLIFKSGLLAELNPDTFFEDPSEKLQTYCNEFFNKELKKEIKKLCKDLPIEALHPSSPFSNHASTEEYEQQFKNIAAHFPKEEELTGCVKTPEHVFSFQYSPEMGHFYIDNWGVFQYPDEKSFFEGLKTQVDLSLCSQNIQDGNENDPSKEASYEISFAMGPSTV